MILFDNSALMIALKHLVKVEFHPYLLLFLLFTVNFFLYYEDKVCVLFNYTLKSLEVDVHFLPSICLSISLIFFILTLSFLLAASMHLL
ncbi:hypothetical protein ACJX0J_030303, partial [Zea mays]